MTARLVVAGTGSGTGKTTVATGLTAALAARGRKVAGFKVGPDFIDPSYHQLASGRPGRNLDPYLCGPELVAPLFAHGAAGADLAVVEGVMGLFDGAAGAGELASTAQVAKLLGAPVLLVLDCAAMARSAAAVAHGFSTFDPDLRVAGLVLNRVASERHEAMLRDALEPLRIPVLGVLRRDPALAVPSRHLGLVPAAERHATARRTVATLGEAVAAGCDLDAIATLAGSASPLRAEPWDPRAAGSLPATASGGPPHVTTPPARRGAREEPLPPSDPVRVAVAAGPAFTFIYTENLELLAASGAEAVPFDPTGDERLPAGSQALYMGGGFPEAHAGELSANAALRAEVRALAAAGRPVVAECGGLLYLARALDGLPMCGVLRARAWMGDRLALGYRQAVAAAPSPVAAAGARLRGHEFHYSRLEPASGDPPAWTLGGRREGFAGPGLHASYLHTHWAAFPQVPARLVAAARRTAR